MSRECILQAHVTWKKVKKKSSFFLAAPRSKHTPHVSRALQTRRMRKKSSGGSREFNRPGVGVPLAVIRISGRTVKRE